MDAGLQKEPASVIQGFKTKDSGNYLIYEGLRGVDFPSSTRPDLGRSNSASHVVGKSDRSVNLTAHLHLVLNLRMCGAISKAWCLIKHSENFIFKKDETVKEKKVL
jgi:hypothetical protein